VFKASIYPELKPIGEYINAEKTYVINRTSKKGYAFRNIILNLRLFWIVLSQNPDVIHITHFYNYQDFFMYFVRRRTVLTVHDPFPHTGENPLEKRIYSFLAYKLLNNFIILNESQRNDFIKQYKLENKRILVSRLGVYDYFSPLQRKLDSNKKVSNILFFGRISPYKGIEYLMQAMINVNKLYPDIKLIVAGGGKYYFDEKQYADKANIEIINRYISNDELENLMDKTSFVVCPYTDATQSGVVMTSYAFLKPVIVTNTGGLAESVDDNTTGLIVEPKSSEQLTQAIIKLIKDSDLLNQMRFNIKEKYFNGIYSWHAITEDIFAFYKQITFKKSQYK
jgi:glycosyltransferase involved in cell wall biosynthesis